MSAESQENILSSIRLHLRAFRVYQMAKTRQCLQALNESQKTAFILSPYLLHAKGPAAINEGLPECSLGCHGYRFDESLREIGQKYFKTKIEKPPIPPRPSIEFIALMGSVGSIAYTDKSDFDYWVCVREDLKQEERKALLARFRRIEKWIERELKVEVHFFLTDANNLKNFDFGTSDAESCGTALGRLLMEEFYRGSLIVCGKVPVWWVVEPGTHDGDYQQKARLVCENASLLDHDLIDIGNLADIPREEFFGGGLWQLNKGIGSPFKSAIKMALLMAYAGQSEGGDILANRLKAMVQQSPDKMESLDPYQLMIDRVLDFYRSQGDIDSMQLLRRCFFLKISPRVSSWMNSNKEPNNLVDRVMLNYVREWKWERNAVEKLEYPEQLSMMELLALKRRIYAFLLRSFNELEKQTQSNDLNLVISERDRLRMTRRFHAVLDENRARIEKFPNYFFKLIVADKYTIECVKDSGRVEWILYRGALNENDMDLKEKFVIAKTSHLSELVAFMLVNKLVRDETKLLAINMDSAHFAVYLRNLASQFRQHIGSTFPPSLDSKAFDGEAQTSKLLLSVNLVPDKRNIDTRTHASTIFDVGYAGFEDENEQRVSLIPSDQKDPLNYGKSKRSLLHCGFLLQKNSWGEVALVKTHSKDWLPRTIASTLSISHDTSTEPEEVLSVHVGWGQFERGKARERIVSLIAEVFRHLQQNRDTDKPAPVCFFEAGGRSHFVARVNGEIVSRSYATIHRLFCDVSLLFRASGRYGGISPLFDPAGKTTSVLDFLYKNTIRSQFDIFLFEGESGSSLILFDENQVPAFYSYSEEDYKSILPRFLKVMINTLQGRKLRYRCTLVTLDSKGNPELRDVTKKIGGTLEKAQVSKYDFRLSLNQAIRFLEYYTRTGDYELEDPDFFHSFIERYEELLHLRDIRKNRNRPYPVYLREIVFDPPVPRRELGTAFIVNLKTGIESALREGIGENEAKSTV